MVAEKVLPSELESRGIEDGATLVARINEELSRVDFGTAARKIHGLRKPTIEFLKTPLFPALTIVPSGNVSNPKLLPAPAFHCFYHRRMEDAQDDLPKYGGYLYSQLRFVVKLIGALTRK